MKTPFIVYLLVCAGITYLIRAVPLISVKEKIKSRYLVSLLYYIPYSVLAVMTIPAIFYSTASLVSACVGFAAALVMALLKRSLIEVAAVACAAVYIAELFV